MKHQEVIIISKSKLPLGESVTIGSSKFKIRSVSNERDELKYVIKELEDNAPYRILLSEIQSW